MIGEPADMAGGGDDSAAQLDAAIDRAKRLLAELERTAADVKKNPPKLSAEDLETGSRAMEGAVASARRLLESLLAARDVAEE